MILYNVTINVDTDVELEWVLWMKTVQIPDVLQTGCFVDYKMLRLLNDDPEATGTTYAVQYFSTNLGLLERYLNEYAPMLQRRHLEKFPNKFVAFRTFLEEV